MSVIAIANRAGSAGKTTTAVALAGLLAADHQRRVRLIDLDDQGDTTLWMGLDQPKGPTVLDLLLERASVGEVERPAVPDVPGLTVLPSPGDELNRLLVQLTSDPGGEQVLRLQLEAAEPVDTTIIDCPGSMNIFVVAALIAADAVVTVTAPRAKEAKGLPLIQDTIKTIAGRYRTSLHLGGIVPCELPSHRAGDVYQETYQDVLEAFGDLVTPPVARRASVPEAYSNRLPLHAYPRAKPAADDYRAVLAALMQRGILP